MISLTCLPLFSTTTPPDRTPRGCGRWLRTGLSDGSFARLLASVCLLAPLVLTGCGDPPPVQETKPLPGETNAREVLEKKRLCLDSFSKIFQVLEPLPENVDTELQSALDMLNQWFSSCAEWTGAPLTPDSPLFDSATGSNPITELNKSSASQRDVLFLRDQLLLRRIIETRIQGVPDDLSKVRRLFEFVNRSVVDDSELISPLLQMPPLLTREQIDSLTPDSIPRSLQDICLAGRGTAEDRVWLFGGLLRQLGIDSLLVVAPQPEQPVDFAVRSIVLVPLDGKLFAFSPGLGIEFASADEGWAASSLQESFTPLFDALPAVPALQPMIQTLRELDWKSATLSLPDSDLRVSPRMAALQLELVGDFACQVYEPPLATDDHPGLVPRLQSLFTPVFPELTPRFWNYPRAMYQQIVDPTPESQQLRNLYLATLVKEVQSLRSSEDQNEQKVFKLSMEKRMLMARIDQLTGDFRDAISTFIKLRLQTGVAGEEAAQVIENLMRFLQAEDAHYWSALAQFENGDYRIARDTLDNYLNRYPEGRWRNAAEELSILSYIEQGQSQPARERLDRAPWLEWRQLRQQELLRQLPSATP